MSAVPEPVERAVRSVSPQRIPKPNPEMSTIGWLVFVGLLFLLVPLLPVVAVVWGISKVTGFLARQTRGGV
jgi:hypothetical protein